VCECVLFNAYKTSSLVQFSIDLPVAFFGDTGPAAVCHSIGELNVSCTQYCRLAPLIQQYSTISAYF